MYSIHFHIQMLDKTQLKPAPAKISETETSTLSSNLPTASHTSQHPHLISPIDNHDNESPPCPAAY